jgi:hypothetical protein
MIFDDFFEHPLTTRDIINAAEMESVKYDDGVTYPNIVRLPSSVENEILNNLKKVFGPIKISRFQKHPKG